ncbi:DUF1450 domain-containing protein, partial [Salmonella enterica subsp. enterica serovar Typhi]|nr:DUF1450 domain-containing protein [Salmonella enterica subsp. enterica serovar Typhi]
GESCFALVDGEIIKGEDSQDLVKKVYQYLAEHPFA